tara:strand:+ start:363 stop:773 length:411 start_codon:yes stop_codon:yes gene_type:complete
MALFSFKNNNKKNKSTLTLFSKKHNISFKAYEILRKLIILNKAKQETLDFASPKNWNPKVLKNISPRATMTLHRLSEKYEKDKNGLISQLNTKPNYKKKPISKSSKLLLNKINNDQNRYHHIDVLIHKLKINKILN